MESTLLPRHKWQGVIQKEGSGDPPGISVLSAQKSELEFGSNSCHPSVSTTPVTIWTSRAIASHSQGPELKTQPPLRWFLLFKCLRGGQSPAWVLREHLGKGLARGPQAAGGHMGSGPPGSRASASSHLCGPSLQSFPSTPSFTRSLLPLLLWPPSLPHSVQDNHLLPFLVPLSLPRSRHLPFPSASTWKSFPLSCLVSLLVST